MPVLTDPPAPPRSATTTALVIADANWFTTANLFRALQRPNVESLLLECHDYRNAWRRGLRPWSWNRPRVRSRPGQSERVLALPSGWMKRFPRLGMRPIAREIDRFRASLDSAARLTLVITYPQYLTLADLVRPDHLVYFNLDDYGLYWPASAERTEALERATVARADATICVGRHRTEQLRKRVPDAAGRIHHLPHGTPEFALAPGPLPVPANAPPDLRHLPRPLLGYIGTLEDRVDWRLLNALAERFSEASIVLIGRCPELRGATPWERDCKRFLERPNVHPVGWRPQSEIGRYNQAFDVCLIPYRVDHPFNIACSPTKIMDCMGSSRPIVATDLPECRLYDQLFHVTSTTGAFLDAVGDLLANGADDGRAAPRHAWASNHACAAVAERFLEIVQAEPAWA